MKHWLVKQEPDVYPWSQFAVDGRTDWTGVRNFQARNFLREMQVGDPVLYYHSVTEKCVVGLATVSREAFPDPTAGEGDWSAVELRPREPLSNPVSLAAIRADLKLSNLSLLRQSRLSVVPVTIAEYDQILHLARPPARVNASHVTARLQSRNAAFSASISASSFLTRSISLGRRRTRARPSFTSD